MANMEKRTQLVCAIMDHPSYLSETAEEWLDRHYHKSFDSLTEYEVDMIIAELEGTKNEGSLPPYNEQEAPKSE